jgi:hypothetical protein
MSIQDDALGKITFTKSRLASDKFVNELVDQSFEHYISNCVHSYTKGDEKNCRKWTWMGLHYNNGQFDPRNRDIVDTEPHFDIVIDEPWAEYSHALEDGSELKGRLAIKGTIDLVTKIEDSVIEVIDWKTGRRINWATGEEKDYNRLESDPQLLLYYYAISKLYPDYDQAIMTVFYIKDGGPFSLCFDDGSKDLFLSMLRKRFNEIKNNKSPQLLSPNQSHWKCTKLCDYYKTNWEGTDTNVCRYVHNHIKKHGIERTNVECAKPDFNIGYYDAPG